MRRKLRVYVDGDYGLADVYLARRRTPYRSGRITIARINLARDDADEQLAEARMKAKDMAGQLNRLEEAS